MSLIRLKSAVVAVRDRAVRLGSQGQLVAARAAEARGDAAAAIRAYEAADGKSPLKPADLSALVGLLGQVRRFDDASVYAERLLAERPRHKRALRALSRSPRPGVDVAGGWRLLAAETPEDPEPWLQIARVSQKLHDHEQVISAADETLARDPQHKEALGLRIAASESLSRHSDVQRGWIKLHSQDPVQARRMLMRALDGDDAGSAAALLAAAEAAGVRDEAIRRAGLRLKVQQVTRAYEAEALNQPQVMADAFWRLRQLAPAEADYDDGLVRATQALRDRIATAPPAEATVLQAVLNRVETPVDLAIAAFEDGPLRPVDAVQTPTGDPLAQAEASLAAGRLEDAVAFWRNAEAGEARQAFAAALAEAAETALAAAVAGGNAEAGWAAAEAQDAVGRPVGDEARGALLTLTRNTLGAAPSSESARVVMLGRAWMTHGGDDPRLILKVGRALMRERLDAEALGVWTTVSQTAPRTPEPWLQIARCAKRMRRPDLGAPALERLFALEPAHEEGRTLSAYFEKLAPTRTNRGDA